VVGLSRLGTVNVRSVASRSAEERGAAFVFVVLVMLGLLVLAHGVLVAALSERAGSHAAVRELEARAAAGVGLSAALATPPGSWLDTVGVGGVVSTDLGLVGRVAVTGALLRLGPESWLVEGEGRLGAAAERAARLAWSMDVVARVTALPGAVSTHGGAPAILAGDVDVAAPDAVAAPLHPGDCDPWLAGLTTHYDTTALSAVGSLPDSTAPPALGLLDFAALSAAPVAVSGSGTPAPLESFGSCLVDAPWSWGDPDQPWQACGSHFAWRSSASDLVVTGGVGQGLLVVDGDVTFGAGARFHGMVVATGTLRLVGGASFVGMGLAAAGVQLDPGTELTGSACWAARAVAAHRGSLSRLVPVASAGQLGPL
jgi:hypothetical protein